MQHLDRVWCTIRSESILQERARLRPYKLVSERGGWKGTATPGRKEGGNSRLLKSCSKAAQRLRILGQAEASGWAGGGGCG
eukprot:SAG31_NODE_38457_length_296_cov_0.741117_1_plen_80_part_01